MEAEQQSPTKYNFEFFGQSGEYFRIWIVNLLLTVITLGIYSAWAKVRTKRYFYGNTLLDGSAFDYTASPMQILKGRLIAVALLIAYSVVDQFFPGMSAYATLVVISLVPAIIVMALAFRMRNTMWRGIRFGFDKDFKRAYLLFLPPILYFAFVAFLPLYLGISSEELAGAEQGEGEISPELAEQLGIYFMAIGGAVLVAVLAFPWWQKAFYLYVGNRTRFGQSQFSFIANAWEFYAIYAAAFVVFAAGIILFALLMVVVAMIWEPLMFAFAFAGFLPYAAAAAYIQTQRTNTIFSNLELDDMHFISELKVGHMFYLYTTNTLAILFTLGLAIPWAMIRVARYRAETMNVFAHDFSRFTRSDVDDENARGEEITDIFGLEIGL